MTASTTPAPAGAALGLEPPPLVVSAAEVRVVERLSRSFVRITFGGAGLAGFGTDGPSLDQRIKLILPDDHGRLPVIARDADWYTSWLALPPDRRGVMRTYTIRRVVDVADETFVMIDFVLHPDHPGPAAAWADRARVGDALIIVGPRRGHRWGGIEFDAGEADRLLLIGDETAVPAIASILEAQPAGIGGHAFIEVPTADDLQDLWRPTGFGVTWLPRDGAAYGARLEQAVRTHLGIEPPTDDLGEIDPEVWETPTYSSSGEAVDDHVGPDRGGLYAWIAGEAGMVTGLRRLMVRGGGFDRRQVCFMGYWRRGAAAD